MEPIISSRYADKVDIERAVPAVFPRTTAFAVMLDGVSFNSTQFLTGTNGPGPKAIDMAV